MKEQKIVFRLAKDEDGYPPDDWESLWAEEVGANLYRIDNIPFFVKGISNGDIVSGRKKDNELFFKSIQEPSGNSVVRVIVFDLVKINGLRSSMEKFGCESEASHIEGLIAFDIPSDVSFDKVEAFLTKGEKEGFWEYEEASIRLY